MQVAVQWNTGSGGPLLRTNDTRIHLGGTHAQGFRTALTNIVDGYARHQPTTRTKPEQRTRSRSRSRTATESPGH
ncbi:hypothetical protein [Streptomyces sp. NBC_01244]|uniref:hypothetical protein n=1 Tax=Streptomyces sp. NBC_01244 TaxID=2903797 RepID=UPI003FA356B3